MLVYVLCFKIIKYIEALTSSLSGAWDKHGLNFRTAPYFIMHAVQCV